MMLDTHRSRGIQSDDGGNFEQAGKRSVNLVHQVRDWFSGAAAYFGWMREAKREKTRCGLRPMSDKAARAQTDNAIGQDDRSGRFDSLASILCCRDCTPETDFEKICGLFPNRLPQTHPGPMIR